MFGIGSGELIMLLALALIIVGPQKLPEMGRTVGKTLAQFKAYSEDMRSVLTFEQTGTPAPAPTSHFPATGAQAYGGATEQMATNATAPASVEPIQPAEQANLAHEMAAVPVPEQPLTPKNYFAEEAAPEPVGATSSATHI